MSILKLSIRSAFPGLGMRGAVGGAGRARRARLGETRGIARFAGERAEVADATRDTCDLRYVSPLLCQALQDEPNLAIEWLWYARRLTRADERRYCLQRALEIDPHNASIRRQLAQS